MIKCRSLGCTHPVINPEKDFCQTCEQQMQQDLLHPDNTEGHPVAQSLPQKYQKYFRSVGGVGEIDIYAVHQLFNIQDPSGCIQSASKKLLLSGNLESEKSIHQTIEEARDSLTRWLELNSAN